MTSTPAKEPAPSRPTTSWTTSVVAGILQNDEDAKAELYARIGSGLRLYFRRQLFTYHVDDLAHNVYVCTLMAIQAGRLREPERLPGYVMTIARRQVIETISQRQQENAIAVPLETMPIIDDRPDPEEQFGSARRIELMKKALSKLAPQERDILVRWYLREQTTATICSETGLTEKQVSNRKHRALLKLKSGMRGRLTPLRRSGLPAPAAPRIDTAIQRI